MHSFPQFTRNTRWGEFAWVGQLFSTKILWWVGNFPGGSFPQGQLSGGGSNFPWGRLSAGELSRGRSSRGKLSGGQFSSEAIIRWAMIQDEIAWGQLTGGKFYSGAIASGAIFLKGNCPDTDYYTLCLILHANWKVQIIVKLSIPFHRKCINCYGSGVRHPKHILISLVINLGSWKVCFWFAKYKYYFLK